MEQVVIEPQKQAEARPTSSKVAVLYTSPDTVLEDIPRLMNIAGVEEALPKENPTLLKINISWQVWYPACSTTPWQLEGVIRGLQAAGYENIIPVQNGTVVVDAEEGERNNKHKAVLDRYGLKSLFLEDPEADWRLYEPKSPLLVLDKVYPNGIRIPHILQGKNIIHLPTMKTHVFTTITGSMKNAFGGLLNYRRHWTHAVIHQTLVDLLAIQRELHPGIFTVTDGTFAGDGPGPRAMRPHIKNTLLAGADPVAVDAIAAKMMGFDPLSIPFIRIAYERGLGCGDPREIEVVGEDISAVNWGFKAGEETLASRGQKLIYWGPLKPLEHFLLRTVIVPWAYLASRLYYDGLWYNLVGRRRIRGAFNTPWGELFRRY